MSAQYLARDMKARKIVQGSWLLLAGAIALVVLAFSHVWIVDDAYITFRYAHNLAEGRGLVFNEGEYVEGYTNFLWTVLMALAELFGIRSISSRSTPVSHSGS
jgi:hypothetical protein